jgi:hypothetical protein
VKYTLTGDKGCLQCVDDEPDGLLWIHLGKMARDDLNDTYYLVGLNWSTQHMSKTARVDYSTTPIVLPICIHVISSKAAKPSSFTWRHRVLMVNTGK